MKYLEEMDIGECFLYSNSYWIVTCDFKRNNERLCINLKSGIPKWQKPNIEVDEIDIFTFDKDSNIIAIKPREKEK